MKHIAVYVVLLQRTLLLDVAGPLEVLRVANREQQNVRFEVHYIGPQASIVSSIGITLANIESLPKTLPDDAMIVLSVDSAVPADVLTEIAEETGASQARVVDLADD